MISIYVVIALAFLHLLGDFFLQSDWMAINKSKSFKALTAHVVVYSMCFSFFGLPFVLITALFHFLTDALTSRITSYLWQKEERHWFFTVIGVDQFIHTVSLLLTYWATR